MDFSYQYAYKAVSGWFQDKDGVLKMKMVSTITTNTEGKNIKFKEARNAIDVFYKELILVKCPLPMPTYQSFVYKEKNFTKYDQKKNFYIYRIG